MSVAVRIADSPDAPAVAHVAAATFALACPPGTEPADIDAFIASTLSLSHVENYISDPKRTVLLAENADGTTVGYCMLVHAEPLDTSIAELLSHRPTTELSKMYVLEGDHGSGVAASLMAAALGQGRLRACSGMWLGVNQHNLRAQKFYGKSGFAVVGTKTFVVGTEVHDDFVMECAL